MIVPYGTIRIEAGVSDERQRSRAEQTRERIRAAAYRLFLRQGYQATSTDAILAEAGISSKETLYRHYAGKEALFIDVLSHLSVDRLAFPAGLSTSPTPHDLPALRQMLSALAREILALMSQPQYLALLRIVFAEAPRFPQLGPLFLSTIPERGLSIVTGILRAAREHKIIADVDVEVVTHLLLGGLLTYILPSLVLVGDDAPPPPALERADAVVEVIMRALTP
jgi:TetR/AcrR family transcriptional regulator, mexJK operon transcriptional repressor